ncbi:MAG: hypothetical protein JWR50_3708 [Mucilaginibacter sp.]|nr:hypothetical protein [Mucilaginibacter sp.]
MLWILSEVFFVFLYRAVRLADIQIFVIFSVSENAKKPTHLIVKLVNLLTISSLN